MVNPKLVDLYGESSKYAFETLISKLGEDTAMTVKCSGYAQIVGDTKIPTTITTTTSKVQYVSNTVKHWLCELGREYENIPVNVYSEIYKTGGMPLCVRSQYSNFGNDKYTPELNREILDLYGNDSAEAFRSLAELLGEEIARTVKVVMCTKVEGGVCIPTNLTTMPGNVSLVEGIIKYWLFGIGVNPNEVVVNVSANSGNYGGVPLISSTSEQNDMKQYTDCLVNSTGNFKNGADNVVLSRSVVELYGEESKEYLECLVRKLGVAVALNVRCAGNTQVIRGMRMPGTLGVRFEDYIYVRDKVYEWISEWAGAPNNNDILIVSDLDKYVGVPLCVIGKEDNTRISIVDNLVINPYVIDTFGDGCVSKLNVFMRSISEDIAKTVYVHTRMSQTLYGVKFPAVIYTTEQNVAVVEEALKNLIHLLDSESNSGWNVLSAAIKRGTLLRDNAKVRILPIDEDCGAVRLCVLESDIKKFKSNMVINPKLVAIFGDDGAYKLKSMAYKLDMDAAKSVRIFTNTSQSLYGTKIPCDISVKNSMVIHTTNVVNACMDLWSSSNKDKHISVFSESYAQGDMPLLININGESEQQEDDVDMTEYFKERMREYKDELRHMWDNLSLSSYNTKCMFIMALDQYIEAYYIVDEDIKSGSYELGERESYIDRKHAGVSQDTQSLIKVATTIRFECYSSSCIREVNNLLNDCNIKSIIDEFGISGNIGSNDGFQVALNFMRGEY